MPRKLVGLITLGDGIITMLWGSGFLRWQRKFAPHWYHPALDWLLEWPDPLLRLGAALEACAGWWLWKEGRGQARQRRSEHSPR